MIEHNVPVPSRRKDRGDMPKMQVGDSIVVHYKNAWATRTAMFRLGWRVSMHKIENDNYRLWRTN